jgi:hypothetical protein
MAYAAPRRKGNEQRSRTARGPGSREGAPAGSVLGLQRAAGNHAVGQLVRQVARRALADEVKEAQPRGLKLNAVFTTYPADYKPFDEGTLLPDVDVVFGPGVNSDHAFRSALQTIAIDDISAIQRDKPKLVSTDDETQEVYIDFAQDFPADEDAKKFAADSGLWRFTFVKLAKPSKGSKVTHQLLIEQVSKGPKVVSTPATPAVRKLREDRFKALGFAFAASGVPSAEATQDSAIAADEKNYTAQVRVSLESDRKALAEAQGARSPNSGKIEALRTQLTKHQKQVDDRTAPTKAFSAAEKDVVLRAVELLPDEFAKRLSGLSFARVGAGAPAGEGADYGPDQHTIRCFDEAFTRGNVWYEKGSENVRTVLHEIGHAIDYAEKRVAHAQNIHASDDTSRKAAEDAVNKAKTLSGGSDDKSAFQVAVKQDGGAITPYGETKRDGGPTEGYAEAFSLYTVDPALLKTLRPHVFAYFEGLRTKGP